MNANELADELQACFTKADQKYVDICADMLRQQQAEIEELKGKLQLHEAMDNQCASLMQQFRKVKNDQE